MQEEASAGFEAYRSEMLADLAPVGTKETLLAERIVRLWWRLQQVAQLEADFLNGLIEKETSNPLAKLAESLLAEGIDLMGDDPEVNPNLATGRAIAKDFSGGRVLERLGAYEQKVEDRLYKTMDEFHELQRVRKQGSGKKPPSSG